ncbi:MAG: CRISPR-associated protein Csx3 [Mariprofundaceae bacterium]|nr:CRISPR-associated protein Csx3 [Mariprofundaceae bacterium]
MITIDVSSLYAATGTAKLADLPEYVAEAQRQAGSGNVVKLTGPGPVWLYLKIAHALHGRALKLIYDSPASGEVVIFDHDPH